MGIVANTFKLFTKPVEIAKQAVHLDKSYSEYLKDSVEYAKSEYKRQLFAITHLKDTNFNLGLKHYSLGNYYDARMRFSMINLFGQRNPISNYYIGRCYFEEGNPSKAQRYLESYIQSDDQSFKEEADYTLNLIRDKSKEIDHIPLRIVEHFYDLVCPVYDFLYMDQAANDDIHHKLFSLTHRALTEKARPFGNKILDLGCGTGAMGKFSRHERITSYLIGVDISHNMIDHCATLKVDQFPVYNETFRSSIDDYFANFDNQHKFNLYFACNLFLSYSDVKKTLDQAYNTSENGAIFSFTIKTHEGTEPFILSPELEEFKYNKEHVMSLISPKWKVIHSETASFIDGEPGMIIILQKS